MRVGAREGAGTDLCYPQIITVEAIDKRLPIGIPSPEVMGPFVGVVETVCGALILFGLLTRLAAVPLIVDMHSGRDL